MIGLLTLFVFIYQTNLIKQQQYKSVFPYLNMGNYYGNSANYTYTIKNQGIGTALIKSVKVINKEGKVFDNIITYVYESTNVKKDSLAYSYSDLQVGTFILQKKILISFKLETVSIQEKYFLRF